MYDKKWDKTVSPGERDLIVGYLSYALDDVRALSDVGSQLLQMTIAAIAAGTASRSNGLSVLENSAVHLPTDPGLTN
jgi:hypothetical protein